MEKNYSLENIVNEVFDKWTCTKKRAPIHTLKISSEANRFDRLNVVKATNPYTGKTNFMGAASCSRKHMNLSIIGTGLSLDNDTHRLFFDICSEVIRNKFEMVCEEVEEDFDTTYKFTINKGRQYFELVESLRKEIIDACRESNVDMSKDYVPFSHDGFNILFKAYRDESDADEWFDCRAMEKSVEYIGNDYVYVDHELDGDVFNKEYDPNRYDYLFDEEDPFYDSIQLLTTLIWKKLNVEVCKYTDFFSTEFDPEEYLGLVPKDPYGYIKKFCTSFDDLKYIINKATETYYNDHANGRYDEKRKAEKLKELTNNFNEDFNDLENGLKNLKYWDSNFISYIASEVEEYREYK